MTSADSNFNFLCGRPHGAGPPRPVHMRPPEPDLRVDVINGWPLSIQMQWLGTLATISVTLIHWTSVFQTPSWETVLLALLHNTSRPAVSQYLLYLVVPPFVSVVQPMGLLFVPRTWTSLTQSRSFAIMVPSNCDGWPWVIKFFLNHILWRYVFMSSSVREVEVDMHPEKRMKAAYLAFEEKNLPILKQENPNLRLSQLKQLLKKDWAKSPENPLNQRLAAVDANKWGRRERENHKDRKTDRGETFVGVVSTFMPWNWSEKTGVIFLDKMSRFFYPGLLLLKLVGLWLVSAGYRGHSKCNWLWQNNFWFMYFHQFEVYINEEKNRSMN